MTRVSEIIIDKLSLTYQCPYGILEGIQEMINGYKADGLINIIYKGAFYNGTIYKKNYHLIINETRNLLQMEPKYRGAAGFRIEWNPNDLGANGNQQLWDILELLFQAEYELFLVNAEVTRIDLAVDVSPLTPDAIWIAADNLHRGNITTGNGGRIETLMLGSRTSDLHFCIYNRDSENNRRIFSDPDITRIEARLKPRCALRELQSIIENPFSRLTIVNAITSELGSMKTKYIHFLDSIRLRGLQGALLTIPRSETRRDYKNWIQENLRTDWFHPDEIFAGYNQALEVLSLPEHLRIRPTRRRIRARSSIA